jgi:hypothetical protein
MSYGQYNSIKLTQCLKNIEKTYGNFRDRTAMGETLIKLGFYETAGLAFNYHIMGI